MDELLELERAGWESLCHGTGSEHYGSIMTEDALMILADGTVMDRAQVVDALGDAPAWDSYSIDDPTVVALGDDTAALVYTGTGHRGEQRFVGRMSSLYVRSGGGWMLALYQQTPVP